MFVGCIFIIALFNATGDGFAPIGRLNGATRMSAIFARKVQQDTLQKGQTQVKLLESIQSLGSKGDVVVVSSAMWLNKLQPKKLAMQISAAQLQQAVKDKDLVEKRRQDISKELIDHIMLQSAVTIARKVGPTFKMFGTVTVAHVLDAIKNAVPQKYSELFDPQNITITSIRPLGDIHGAEGAKTEEDTEIRTCGQYTVTMQFRHAQQTAHILLHVVPTS
jgi:ribosomal protein L9